MVLFYAGFEASAAFDPLVAKVIASAGSHDAVLDRLGRALAEFQIDGVATNLAHLCALVADDRVRRGDARTTLLDESPVFGGGHGSPALDLFRSVGDSTATATRRSRQGLTADGDIEAVVSPVNSTVVEVLVARGEQVDEGQALIVCSAMKMETVLTAPCAGLIVELLALAEGTTVYEGDVLALIEPGAGSGVGAGITRTDAGWSPDLAQAEELRALAHARLAPGVARSGSCPAAKPQQAHLP